MTGKARILIVEDQKGFRTIYEDVLVHAGYEVTAAEDGEKGWRLSKEKKPDLVLLDLGLPVIDGFEVLRRMRADSETQNIPVIIFSVMGEQNSVKKAMEMGANDYTIKGFYTPMQILSKIKGQLIQVASIKAVAPFQIPLVEGGGDAAKLQKEIGLKEGCRCAHCGGGMKLEMFPDHLHNDSHWFSSRLICSQCGKPA